MLTLQQNTLTSPINAGDSGIVIKPDGTPLLFNTYTAEQLAAPTQKMMDDTKDLYAILVALKVPQVMEVLRQVASDPNIVGDQGLGTGLPN